MADIIDVLARHAADRPDTPLYSFLDGFGDIAASYTYRSFDNRTSALARGLLGLSRFARGDHVLLVYPPGLDFIAAFFACVKLGAVPVPVAPPDSSGLIGGLEKLAYVASDAGIHVALTNESYLQQLYRLRQRSPEGNLWLQREPLSSLIWVATDGIEDGPACIDQPANPILFLQYTSGSTQQPRGVMVSHDNVIHNCRATLQHRPIGVSWLPHYHDMGLIGYYLFILIAGGSMYGFSGAQFLRRPLLWFETITRYRGTITSAPNFAFEYCLRRDKVPDDKLAELDLSSVVCMMNASEPVRASTYERFQARFGPYGLSPSAHMVFYGLAENTLSVTGGGRVSLTLNTSLLERNQVRIETPRHDNCSQSRIMSCGRPLPGIDVRIVSLETSRVVGDGVIGQIWIGGRSRAEGYLNEPSRSRKHFRSRIDGDDSATSYLRTGDIGFMHDGELFICARLKDLIIIGGRNYYPGDIEAVVEAASPKVRQGCVAAFAIDSGLDGEGIAVLLEARRANDLPDLKALCREVRKRCLVEPTVLAVVPSGTVTKTSSGKIARQSCRKHWEAGAIDAIASRIRSVRPCGDQILEDLLGHFGLDCPEDRTLADLGIDSISLVEMSLYLGRLFEARGDRKWSRTANAWSDLRILQAITVGELRTLLAVLVDGSEISDTAPQMIEAHLEKAERDEVARMCADARLPSDIAPRVVRILDNATVLLTGATGFLGAFVLEALLRLTQHRIVALVRAVDDDHARRRALAALERTGLLDPALHLAFNMRVRAVSGDLSQPRLGLSLARWVDFSDELSAIYHCGAEVDYVRPYEHLRNANVSSTVEIVRLASAGCPKSLHYTSTTFMFGFVTRRICLESDSNREMAGLSFCYTQSKWVAEQLVLDAAARGLTAQIYRPSLITASRDGKYIRHDLMSRILSYMIRHGVSVDSANQISFVPVDVCANNIVALSLLDGTAPPVVHITADSYYTMRDVCASISAQAGYIFEYLPLEAFIEHMNAHCDMNDPMFPLLAFFNENWRKIDAMRNKRYDNVRYREARECSSVTLPEPPLDTTIRQIVEFLQQEDLVPPAAPQKISAV